MELLKICSFEGRAFKRGYVFHSDTDTEVLINLIEEVQKRQLKIRKSSSSCFKPSGRCHAIAVFDKKIQMKLLLPIR
jgi:glucosamine--fructose-6-phosphate aminotransferase (isomerizing)